jgi:hypothetical protein
VFLYTLRNKRGIGHLGGDVEANKVDLKTAVQVADWIVCELIRIYYKVSIEDAQSLVDSLTMKEIPDIWEVNGKKRVLKEGLDNKQKTLMLLYSQESSFAFIEDLCDWIEYTSVSHYKNRIIVPMHSQRLLDFDETTGAVVISPIGIKIVEEKILGKESPSPSMAQAK